MVYTGTVQNGVVVLDGGATIPDGTVVHVAPASNGKSEAGGADGDDPLFAMADLAVETGIADLATNVDHYLYGHPKKNDAGE